MPTADTVPCEACSGSGLDALGDLPCADCAGYGYLPNPFRPPPLKVVE
jgi:DnaJ-class molecular chaperone